MIIQIALGIVLGWFLLVVCFAVAPHILTAIPYIIGGAVVVFAVYWMAGSLREAAHSLPHGGDEIGIFLVFGFCAWMIWRTIKREWDDRVRRKAEKADQNP